mgnify:CR=1 FL=1
MKGQLTLFEIAPEIQFKRVCNALFGECRLVVQKLKQLDFGPIKLLPQSLHRCNQVRELDGARAPA